MKNSSESKISVIIATYNSSKVIKRCLDSLIDQENKAFNIVIVDGNSDDGTLNLIKQYNFQNISIISEPDNGIYDAWNKGLKLVTTDWVFFLGSDDILYSDAIATMASRVPTENNIDIVTSCIDLVNGKGEIFKRKGTSYNRKSFLKHMTISHVGCLHNMDLFRKYGDYDISYKIAGDYELLLRPKFPLRATHINKSIGKMEYGGVSTENIDVLKETFHAKIKTGKVPFLKASIHYIEAYFKFILKRLISYGK